MERHRGLHSRRPNLSVNFESNRHRNCCLQNEKEMGNIFGKASKSQEKRIEALNLATTKEACLKQALSIFTDFRDEGQKMIRLDATLFCIATAFGAAVPVLSGLQGIGEKGKADERFSGGKEEIFDEEFILNICVMILSLLSLIIHSVIKTCRWGQRGFDLLNTGNELERLYEDFMGNSMKTCDEEEGEEGGPYRIPDLSRIPKPILQAYVDNLKPKSETKGSVSQSSQEVWLGNLEPCGHGKKDAKEGSQITVSDQTESVQTKSVQTEVDPELLQKRFRIFYGKFNEALMEGRGCRYKNMGSLNGN